MSPLPHVAQPRKKSVFRILMVTPISWDYHREIVRGARSCAFSSGCIEVGNWGWREGHFIDGLREAVERQEIDGIIASANSRAMEDELLRMRLPVVNVSNVLWPARLPLVTQDDVAVGRLAATHLMGCGCTTFAYWEESDARFSQERIRGFLDELNRRMPEGVHAACIAGGSAALRVETEDELHAKMRDWLKNLPPQTGVFAVLDPFALHLLQAAREEGRSVPDDLAVIGAGDDEFWVDFERIPLSSVKLPAWQIGMRAATLLETLMRAQKKKGKSARPGLAKDKAPPCLYLPVSEVSARRSTDVLFSLDEAVAKAVAFVRSNATRNIYVPDVVRASGISRTYLQKRFLDAIGHSILDEIQLTRIERVKTLLRTTDKKMTAIAEECDFPNTPRLHVVFRQITGRTPGEYRAIFRRR